MGRGLRLAKAGNFGADVTVDFEKVDPVWAVREAAGGTGIDQAFECSGAHGTFCQAVEMVKRGGAVVLLGVPQGEVDEELPFRYVVSNEIAIFGSKANPNVSSEIISLIAADQLVVRDLVTHVFPLAEYRTALLTFLVRKDGAMKVIVEPNGPETDDMAPWSTGSNEGCAQERKRMAEWKSQLQISIEANKK